MVRDGGVREQDRVGNNAADDAADFGRRRVDFLVMDARRNFSGVRGRYIKTLHQFFIAIPRAAVNHVGNNGIAPHPLVWYAGALLKRRGLVHAVRDRAFLRGPAGTWDGEWISLAAALVTAEDVGTWPYSVGILVKWIAF